MAGIKPMQGLISSSRLLFCKTELWNRLLQEAFHGVLLVNSQAVLGASFYSHHAFPMCFPCCVMTVYVRGSSRRLIPRCSGVHLIHLRISSAWYIQAGQMLVRTANKLRC